MTPCPSAQTLFRSQSGSDTSSGFYRIPALVDAGGTLLAFAEHRESLSDASVTTIVERRSVDHGCTWSLQQDVSVDPGMTRGNPTPVYDQRTKTVVLISCGNGGGVTAAQIDHGQATAEQGRRVYVQTSTDDGASFSDAREITDEVKLPTWRWYASGPGHATYVTTGPHAGRIVVPGSHSVAPPDGHDEDGGLAQYSAGHDFYSDDDGATWQLGFVTAPTSNGVNVNETTATELPDGRLYFNARNAGAPEAGARVATYSSDGGSTLDHAYAKVPRLPGPVVEGSALALADGSLVFSGPRGMPSRQHLLLHISHDDGRTWTARTITTVRAGYSDLVATGRNQVGVLYETGTRTSTDTIDFQIDSDVPVGQTSTNQTGDFAGRGVSDIALFTPSTARWHIRGKAAVQYGRAGDVPVPGDFDGDGRSDLAVFRPSTGQWLVRGRPTITWGRRGDVPVLGDFDGDGRSDLAVFRRSTGQWLIRGRAPVTYGRRGDQPVARDWTGDGITDLAVYRPSTGQWLVHGQPTITWGRRGDIPVPGDYDGNGTTEPAVYRPSTGQWLVRGAPALTLGRPGDVPAPGNYHSSDTHGLRTLAAVYRPSTGTWLIATDGTTAIVHHGKAGDRPV